MEQTEPDRTSPCVSSASGSVVFPSAQNKLIGRDPLSDLWRPADSSLSRTSWIIEIFQHNKQFNKLAFNSFSTDWSTHLHLSSGSAHDWF